MAAPKCHPRWGGRKKGTPNRINAAARDRIEKEADPVGFLCLIIRGHEIDGSKPTLDQRLNAAKVLAGKVLPDLRAVEIEHTVSQKDIIDLTDEELLELAQVNGGSGVLAEVGDCLAIPFRNPD
jgi:hypothetical protein